MGTMSKEEILKILEDAKDKNSDVPMRLVRQAFEKLPEPCEDTINRQAAIDALMAEPLKWDDSSVWESARCHQWMMDMDVIKALPSAPERKRGEWIMKYKGSAVTSYKCSECGRTVKDDTGYDVSKDYPFCHCGADMR